MRWQTVYDLLDASGAVVLTETARWSMRETNGRFLIDLEWRGDAKTDVTIGRYDYGGLFLRMPWRAGMAAEVVNAARQRDSRAEGQRAMWIDVGMRVDGRSDFAHIALFDHPDNTGYPTAWRVDSEFGVGSARTRSADFTLAKGQTEVLRHQIVVHTGTLNDVELTNAWTEFSGNRSTSALWGIAQREGRDATFLTPADAVAAMTLANGFAVNTWAAEPTIAQPMAFAWDDRGRLWVAENHDYETRGRGFSNAGTSRILILEDTDRDGSADRRTVFMEGIVFPSALAIGFDGVFVGAPPNLLFVPDRDHDDKADVANIEVRLTGWGIQDRHEVLNSLHWGPDGWLYGLQGYATTSRVRKPAGRGRLFQRQEPFPDDLLKGDGIEINGGVWRYHPTKDVFEVVAHGFSNPWGIDYDAKGQLLISACVIPHLFHVVPGGIYHRQGGQHFNPYVYSDIQTIADHRHRSAHGGARVYQSDAFPASQQGRVFMANIHEHAVLSDVLARKGSGFTARHGEDVLMANNAQWIGFSLEVGPDGAIYVLDWHDGDICGNDVRHQDTGRIYRISPAQSLAAGSTDGMPTSAGCPTRSSCGCRPAAATGTRGGRASFFSTARPQRTLSPGTHEGLRAMFRDHDTPDIRLRAMWALHVTGGWTAAALSDALRDRDEYIRAWAIQLLSERSRAIARRPRPVRADGEERSLAGRAPLSRVGAATARRLDSLADRRRVAQTRRGRRRSESSDDGVDWDRTDGGREPGAGAGPRVAKPRPAGRPVHRAPRGGGRSARAARRRAGPRSEDDHATARRHAGRSRWAIRPGRTDELDAGLRPTETVGRADGATGERRGAALRRCRHGSTQSRIGQKPRGRDRPTAAGAPDADRATAASTRSRTFPSSIDDPALRTDAIRAVAAYDDEPLGKLLVAKYPSLDAEDKKEAVQALASRATYGRLLTEALARQAVPRRDIPPHVARQLRRVVGAKFADVWGPVETSAVEDRTLSRYRSLLTDRALAVADVRNGRAIFQQSCGACHRMYGEGGVLGPDLTGSNRINLDYLLFNVLNPSGDVPDAYRLVVVTTRDGRTFSGTVIGETDRQLTLREVGREPAIISKADIQSRETTPLSMMPQGLFDALLDREVIDLVAYLRTMTPVRTP